MTQSKYARGRARRKARRYWTGFEYSADTIEALILMGRLTEAESRNKAKCRAALEALVEELTAEVVKKQAATGCASSPRNPRNSEA
jgi:hypothetical protein